MLRSHDPLPSKQNGAGSRSCRARHLIEVERFRKLCLRLDPLCCERMLIIESTSAS